MKPFPTVLFHAFGFAVTDATLVTFILSLLMVTGLRVTMAFPRGRRVLELLYETLEESVVRTTTEDVRPLLPLVLTIWLFVGTANLVGVVPGVASPTRDLSLATALAAVSFLSGHVHAFRTRGFAYLRQYIEPNPLLLPFNIIGEISRTVALALRLFGNMLSGYLIGAIVVYLAGLLVPVPLLLLSVLTSVVQAYIFGVLTLVFAASSAQTAERTSRTAPTAPSGENQ
jgi:F-type H+-transporting ATPase subunit a